MVNLEIEKPSDWSIGKKIGFIAIILLIIGPFLPYTGNYSYIHYDYFGFLRFIPFLSAVLIAFLLYFKFPVFFKKDTKYVRINHFILMIWGFWFLISYFNEALPYLTPGYGLWVIIAGYFMCILAGVLEWRFPSAEGSGMPLVRFGKKKEKEAVTEVSAEPSPEITTTSGIEKPVPLVKTELSREEQVVEPEPVPVAPTPEAKKIETLGREPTTDEEKMLLKWASHINEYGQTFEKCTKCNNYVFMRAKDTGDVVVFNCPDCGASFLLKK